MPRRAEVCVVVRVKKGPYWALCVQRFKVYYFFLAFGLGKSVILPSYISAAKPIDSLSVG